MVPIIISSPESMVKVRVMTVKDYSDKTLKTLHRAGVLHIEESAELKPIDRAAIESERREGEELLTYIDTILAYVPSEKRVSLGEEIEVTYAGSLEKVNSEARQLYTHFTNLQERALELSEEIKRLRESRDYLVPLARQSDIRLKDLDFSGAYLFSEVLVLYQEAFETLYSQIDEYLLESIATTIENETVFYIIAKVEHQKVIQSIIEDAGGKVLQVPDEDLPLNQFAEVAEGKIHRLEQELAKLRGKIQSKVGEKLERLVLLREVLLAENERLLVLEKAVEAKYVTLIEGWIPENNIETTISELKENIDYMFVDTRQPDRLEEPPTKLKNPSGTKPFQVIVNLFGIPKYREWDPTPVVAYSFAFFFGLMLCDVVYALGIILVAKFLLSKFVDDSESEGFKLFQRLIYTSSGVALVGGLLTGTYLGDIHQFLGIESLALVGQTEQALQDPMSFILLSLVIGFVHVNIGHGLGFIRGVKEKQKGIIPNKIGIFALQICGIPVIMHAMFNVDIPLLNAQVYSILTYILLVSVILIIASSVMQKGVFLGGIFWIFDLTGLLGDVMSYARLAGVGLATFYLASVFNMMGGWFSSIASSMIPGVAGAIIGGIVIIFVLVVGHALNLLLAGLASFIHSLRLCFVEFLFKFYEGGGREYSPFRLRTRTPVLVKGGSVK